MSPLLLRRLSDEQLGSRLAAGEAAAFDELYRRYVHRLSAYGANLLGDAATGDDVAQSALLKAYGALRDGRLPDRVKPWLYRIAHNTAIDLVARRRELPSADLPEVATAGGEPLEPSGALVAALASLPERQRRVYVLRELHGLRIDETAAELGLSPPQVEQSLFAARNRLAEHLVFGDRLNCVAVQRLVTGPLDTDERRALKTHLRSCSSCRATTGLRGRALGLLPAASFDWLRGLFAGLATGGAPAAAKVGAVVVTATFAAGVSGAADQASHHPRPVIAPDAVAPSPPPEQRAVALPTFNATTQPAAPPSRFIASPARRAHESKRKEAEHHRSGHTEEGSSSPAAAGAAAHEGESDGRSGSVTTALQLQPAESGRAGDHSGGDGGGRSDPTTHVTTTGDQLPTTTVDSGGSHDGGGSDGSGSDGSGGDGTDSGSGDGSSHD